MRVGRSSKTYSTRYAALGLRCDAPGLWRWIDLADNPGKSRASSIGPFYGSSAEAWGDLERFAGEYFGDGLSGAVLTMGGR